MLWCEIVCEEEGGNIGTEGEQETWDLGFVFWMKEDLLWIIGDSL